jgi:hypothetical protein
MTPSTWHTPERDAILRRYWPSYLPSDDLFALLDKAAGPPMPPRRRVGTYVQRLKLRRPTDILINKEARAAAARELHGETAPNAVLVIEEFEPFQRPVFAREDNPVQLVAPGTYPARGFTMLRGMGR